MDLIGEIEKPLLEWNKPDFPNDILAFKYIHEQSQIFARNGDYSSKEAVKYNTTVKFLKDILGKEIYSWCYKIAFPNN